MLRNQSSYRGIILLRDTNFAEGFCAAFIDLSEYNDGRRRPLAEMLQYRDISLWQVFLIPDGPVPEVGVKTYLGLRLCRTVFISRSI